jgi:hypothetical protein
VNAHDPTGVMISVGDHVAILRPGGGVSCGKVQQIVSDDLIIVRMHMRIQTDLSTTEERLSEQTTTRTVLVLK